MGSLHAFLEDSLPYLLLRNNSNVKPASTSVGPDRADAGPDFLAGLVFARASAVVEDVGWCVWHRNALVLLHPA